MDQNLELVFHFPQIPLPLLLPLVATTVTASTNPMIIVSTANPTTTTALSTITANSMTTTAGADPGGS